MLLEYASSLEKCVVSHIREEVEYLRITLNSMKQITREEFENALLVLLLAFLFGVGLSKNKSDEAMFSLPQKSIPSMEFPRLGVTISVVGGDYTCQRQ